MDTGINSLNSKIENTLSWIIYPFTMLFCLMLFLLFRNTGGNFLAATYLPLLFSSLFIFILERYMVYNRQWIPRAKDWINDSVYFVLVQSLLSKALVWMSIHYLFQVVPGLLPGLAHVWPHQWSLGIQLVMVILLSDLLRYWLHRLSHTIPFLWRFHAVHHSVDKLYWLNTSRFHPIEKGLQFMFDVLPFMLLSVSEEIIALHFVLYAVNGSFQHCNIRLKYGWLNYIVSSTDLHRWHHSRTASESNSNYGNNVIIWDLLFGSFYWPRTREVEEIGLHNKNYPLDFLTQMKTPFITDIDQKEKSVLSFKDNLLNLLLAMKMWLIEKKFVRPFIEKTKDPLKSQNDLLLSILSENKDTLYGRKYGFSGIKSYAEYKAGVPLVSYEDLRPYIEKQDKEKVPVLTSENAFMFNQTSGTTGKPKYIPVLKSSMKRFAETQQIFTYIQYKYAKAGYRGKILGIAGAAIEGYLETGTPYGSASGQLLKSMPALARLKYALPYEIFGIKDYQQKYYIMARLAAEQDDITYIATANPSTFHKLLEVINSNFSDIIDDIRNGTCKGLENLTDEIQTAIRKRISKNVVRAQHLEKLKKDKTAIAFSDIWPELNILACWLGGSCGLSLKGILPAFPKGINVIELGYVSSEFRGTITMDAAQNLCVPALHEVFFEFIEQEDFEAGKMEFKTLHQLEEKRSYYIFITTATGLYRCEMNDILKVEGFYNKTPQLRFIQKGKGATNITGEKLYECQLIDAMRETESICGTDSKFYIMLADEENSCYELYFEPYKNTAFDEGELITVLDEKLAELNLEYGAKRDSARLLPLKFTRLKQGAYEAYKNYCLSKGQKEGQFKTILLQYKKDMGFNFNQYADQFN